MYFVVEVTRQRDRFIGKIPISDEDRGPPPSRLPGLRIANLVNLAN